MNGATAENMFPPLFNFQFRISIYISPSVGRLEPVSGIEPLT